MSDPERSITEDETMNLIERFEALHLLRHKGAPDLITIEEIAEAEEQSRAQLTDSLLVGFGAMRSVVMSVFRVENAKVMLEKCVEFDGSGSAWTLRIPNYDRRATDSYEVQWYADDNPKASFSNGSSNLESLQETRTALAEQMEKMEHDKGTNILLDAMSDAELVDWAEALSEMSEMEQLASGLLIPEVDPETLFRKNHYDAVMQLTGRLSLANLIERGIDLDFMIDD